MLLKLLKNSQPPVSPPPFRFWFGTTQRISCDAVVFFLVKIPLMKAAHSYRGNESTNSYKGIEKEKWIALLRGYLIINDLFLLLLLLLWLLAAWPSFNLTPAIGNAKVALSTPSRHKYPKGRLFLFSPPKVYLKLEDAIGINLNLFRHGATRSWFKQVLDLSVQSPLMKYRKLTLWWREWVVFGLCRVPFAADKKIKEIWRIRFGPVAVRLVPNVVRARFSRYWTSLCHWSERYVTM